MKSCLDLLKLLIILKNRAVNTRLLKALCDEMGSDHPYLLFHSEVRWLSCCEVLMRLYELRNEVKLFLINKKSDLSHYFHNKKWVVRLAYLCDIFSYINELSLNFKIQIQQYFMFGLVFSLRLR